MKTLSDMVGHKRTPEGNIPLDERTDLMMRKMELSESLSAKLFCAQPSHAAEDERGITDLLIQGLVGRLPKPDGIWPLDDRAKWLRTAASIFDLVYKRSDDEHREIRMVFAKQGAGNPLMTGLGVAEAKEGSSPGESKERSKILLGQLHE